MRYVKVSDPVYAPNSKGGPAADTVATGSRPAGMLTGRWSVLPIHYTPKTTTGVRPPHSSVR